MIDVNYLFCQTITKTEDNRIAVLYEDGTYKFGELITTKEGKEIILLSDGTYFQKKNPKVDSITNAQFVGGETAFREFIGKNLQYPKRCQDEGINGSVVLKFIVDETGRISSVTAIEETKSCPEFTEEAIRVVKKSPLWIPKEINGRYVPSWREIPIKFTI